MSEWKLFGDTIPDYTTPAWYAERDAAPHLEQEGHRQRLLETAASVWEAFPMVGTDHVTVVDLGAGDGGLLSLLDHPQVTCWGYDLQPTNVKAAADRGVDVTLADFDCDPIRWADIVVISEVLEHLIDPHAMVRRIHDSAASFLVATSPYTETDESHYGFHTWAWDQAGYRSMIEGAGWRVLETRTAWISQIVLAERAA